MGAPPQSSSRRVWWAVGLLVVIQIVGPGWGYVRARRCEAGRVAAMERCVRCAAGATPADRELSCRSSRELANRTCISAFWRLEPIRFGDTCGE